MEQKTFVEDPVYSKVNKETGEIETLKVSVRKHVEDFFCMYLEAWDDFTDREGYLKTVFTWCILQSKYSAAGSNMDGNIFHVSEVLDYATRKYPEKDIKTLSNTISKLVKRGFIIKHESMRGCYWINPKYGVKGNISEKMFVRLSVRANFTH
jgi:hypothetical protein